MCNKAAAEYNSATNVYCYMTGLSAIAELLKFIGAKK